MSNLLKIEVNEAERRLVLAGLGSMKLMAERIPGTPEQVQARLVELGGAVVAVNNATPVDVVEEADLADQLTPRQAMIIATALGMLLTHGLEGKLNDDLGLNLTPADFIGLENSLNLSSLATEWAGE